MKLKTIILTTALAATSLVIPVSIHAQTATPAASVAPGAPPKFGPEGKGRPGKWNPEERLAKLKVDLALTPDQETKIRDILKTEADKAKANREANKDTPVAPEERRTKMQAARAETSAAIKAVLTPEQLTKFEAMKKDRGPKGGSKSDAPAPAVPTP